MTETSSTVYFVSLLTMFWVTSSTHGWCEARRTLMRRLLVKRSLQMVAPSPSRAAWPSLSMTAATSAFSPSNLGLLSSDPHPISAAPDRARRSSGRLDIEGLLSPRWRMLLQHALLGSVDRRLNAVLHLKLGQHVGDVVLHGAGAHEQLVRDLLVVVALGHE